MADSSGMRAGLQGNVDEALRLFAMEAEWGGLNLAETEFVLEEALKCYGSIADASQVRNLFVFYRRYLGMADVGRRQALLTRITEFVSDGRQNRYLALLCFLNADTDGQIVSGAALDVAMVMPQESGDPLTGPKHVALHSCGGLRAKMGRPGSDDEGYAAAGLLLLGDMRLLPMLEEIWERLTPEARRRMVQRRSNLVSALMVEFLLRRLEADKAEEYFGELGAALHNLPEIASQLPISAVMDIRRNFGLPAGKEPMELLCRETLAEAFVRIRPRLEALIARETEPKVLPAALAVWTKAAGCAAATDDAETEEDAGAPSSAEEVEPEYFTISEELAKEFDGPISDELLKDDRTVPELYCWLNPYEMATAVTADELLRDFKDGRQFPILVTGIFNPFGPTLVIYAVHRHSADRDWALRRYQLNPFDCKATSMGWLESGADLTEGVIVAEEGAKGVRLAMQGRKAGAIDGVHAYVTETILGLSRLQPSSTLCVASCHVSPEKSLARMTKVYQATKNGRDDLDDLRDKQKRTNPWLRADMAEIMKRIRERKGAPAPLTAAEAKELASIVLSPQQQRLEMLNLLQAWEGAIGHSGMNPVLASKQLLQVLVFLTPDMPDLINLKGDFFGAPSGKPSSDVISPVVPDAAVAAAGTPDGAPKKNSNPHYRGILRLIYGLSALEILLCLIAVVWSLLCAEWMLFLALLAFSVLNFLRIGGVGMRDAWTRWFAIGLYGLMLWYVGYRIHQHNLSGLPSGAAFLLLDVLVFWFGPMCFLNLICFDYAKQMRDAPEKAD